MSAPARRLTVRPRAIVHDVPAAQLGAVIGGKYRIDAPIGEGGTGRIFRARHLTLDSPVAVKFVSGWVGEDKRLERFQEEARIAASIRHRHVVTIMDFGVMDGEPYMVMELLDGWSLDDRMMKDRLPIAESVDVMCQVLAGLDAVHRAGIVHGDIKPANVFLTPDDDGSFARLLDFGVSRAAHGDLPADSVIVGTPEYMSPEQAIGAKLDARSDLYSAGVVLYELLSGHVPFEHADPIVVVERVAFEAPPPLAKVAPHLGGLAAVVDRALAREPDKRFQTARELRRALLEQMGMENTGRFAIPVEARRLERQARSERPTEPLEAVKPKPSSRAALWVAALIGLGLLALSAVAFWQATRDASADTRDAPDTPPFTPPVAAPRQTEPAPRVEPTPATNTVMVEPLNETPEPEATPVMRDRRTTMREPRETMTGVVRDLDF